MSLQRVEGWSEGRVIVERGFLVSTPGLDLGVLDRVWYQSESIDPSVLTNPSPDTDESPV